MRLMCKLGIVCLISIIAFEVFNVELHFASYVLGLVVMAAQSLIDVFFD